MSMDIGFKLQKHMENLSEFTVIFGNLVKWKPNELKFGVMTYFGDIYRFIPKKLICISNHLEKCHTF